MDETYKRLKELGYPSLAAFYKARILDNKNKANYRQEILSSSITISPQDIENLILCEPEIYTPVFCSLDNLAKQKIRYHCNTAPLAGDIVWYIGRKIHYNTVTTEELYELENIVQHNPPNCKIAQIARHHLMKHYTYNYITQDNGTRIRIAK